MKSNIKTGLVAISKRIKKSAFIKSVLTLSAGAVISQAISLCSTPIVSRIYDPAVIGDFSILTSDLNIISSIICLGLMTAIMIPKEDGEARDICRTLLVLILSLSTILFVTAILLSGKLRLFTVSVNYNFACLILYIYVILSNISSLCYAYVNREKMYKVLFWNPALGTMTNATISIVLGLLGWGLWGYSLGNILAALIVIIHMLLHVNPFLHDKKEAIHPLYILKKYKEFPLYQFPSNLVGTLASQIPIQMISAYWGNAVVGAYSMCLIVLGLPSKFLAGPINRVFYREATERYNSGENIGVFSFNIIETNIKLALIPISALIIFGKQLFSFVLGSDWMEAGYYASILGIYQLMQFSNACIAGKFIIIRKQKTILILNALSAVLYYCTFIICHALQLNVVFSLSIFAIIGACFELADTTVFMIQTKVAPLKYLNLVTIYLVLPALLSNAMRIILFGN